MNDVFTTALGLAAPWAVSNVDFDIAKGSINFVVEYEAKRAPCPKCSAPEQRIHDRVERTWQHLHFFQYRAFIKARVPRVKCAKCQGVVQLEVPWSRPGAGFSQLFEAFIVALAQALPVNQIAVLTKVSDDRIWRVLHHHTSVARSKESHADVSRIGVDETSARKGQDYITLVHDLDRERLLFATPGRKSETLAAFAEDLEKHGGSASAITDISMDFSAAYQKGARENFPQAKPSYDPYHAVAIVGRALEQVRRAEAKKRADELRGLTWSIRKDVHKWSEAEHSQMHDFQRSNLQTARGWRLKEALRDIYRNVTDRTTAAAAFKSWISWASRSRLAPFKRTAATFKAHLDGILNHFESGLSNARVEAMNGRIQAAKKRARGYRTSANLITIAYLICGNLKELPKNPWIYPVTLNQ